MSTNGAPIAPIAPSAMGLVLPNFARNKLAAAAANKNIPTPVISAITPRLPVITPKSIPSSTSPTIPTTVTPITPRMVVVTPKSIPSPKIPVPTPVAPPLVAPRIMSPKVIKPCDTELITPHLSQHNLPARQVNVLSPGLSLPRIKTPGRIAITPSVSVMEDNPWLPPKSDGDPLFIKVAAMTPIGTIAAVPTATYRPPPTPRRVPLPRATPGRPILKIVEEPDPLLNATIYLDVGDSQDRDYVANHMRSIAAGTNVLQKQYATQYRALPNVYGRVTVAQFEMVLSIYENNQVYYQDRLDDKLLQLSAIKQGLTDLEYWFMRVIEPVANDDIAAWQNREQFKIQHGYSSFCDPELYSHITAAPTVIRTEIQRLQYN